MEGRTLALALGGRDVSYPGVLGTGVVKMPGLNGPAEPDFPKSRQKQPDSTPSAVWRDG